MTKHLLLITFILSINSFMLFPDETGDNTGDLAVIEGDEMIVTGTRDTTTQKHDVITRKEIDEINPRDLPDLLETALNISIKQNGGYGTQSTFSIRGNSSSEVLVLIDGVPVNSSQSGDVNLSSIPLNGIKKIEITYGGSDTKYNYSGAIGGIINIITKDTGKSSIYADLDMSNLFYYPEFYYADKGKQDRRFPGARDFFDTQKITFNLGAGGEVIYWDESLGVNFAQNHYLYKDGNDVMRQMDHNGVLDMNLKNTLRFNLPKFVKLAVSNTDYHADREIHGSMNNKNFGHETENQIFTQINFNADMVGTDKVGTEASVSHKLNYLQWNDSSSNDIHNLNTVMLVNRWNFLPLEWFLIQVGGDFSYDNLDSTTVGQKDVFNGGGYLTLEFTIGKIAKIISSVKINYDKNFTGTVPVIPKAGVAFFIGKYFTLKSNFYRTYRNPDFNDLYWPEDAYAKGNPDLRTETGFGGDMTLMFDKKGILSADSSLFLNYLQDAIIWAPQSGNIWTPENIGKSFYLGFENKIRSDFSKYVELSASYNFLMTWVLTNGLGFEADKRMPYKPVHTLGFGVTVKWNTGKKYAGNISFSGHYESDRYTDELNVGKLNPYFTLDVSLNQNIFKMVTLYVTVKNMLDDHYFLVDKYPVPAGSITLGIRINFEKTLNESEGEKNDKKRD
jgi:vitamin B12 transporter